MLVPPQQRRPVYELDGWKPFIGNLSLRVNTFQGEETVFTFRWLCVMESLDEGTAVFCLSANAAVDRDEFDIS